MLRVSPHAFHKCAQNISKSSFGKLHHARKFHPQTFKTCRCRQKRRAYHCCQHEMKEHSRTPAFGVSLLSYRARSFQGALSHLSVNSICSLKVQIKGLYFSEIHPRRHAWPQSPLSSQKMSANLKHALCLKNIYICWRLTNLVTTKYFPNHIPFHYKVS